LPILIQVEAVFADGLAVEVAALIAIPGDQHRGRRHYHNSMGKD
jgi:hypothetical protein